MNNLSNIPAYKIGLLIKSGQIKSREVVEYFIQKIKRNNPKLNAMVFDQFDEALNQADFADLEIEKGNKIGVLHGIPFTIKECLDLVGTPSTFGLLRRKNDIPKETDKYVQLLINEGAIVLGKSNVSQLLASIESQNPVYGTTNNAHSSRHSSGGSSGGEGALIASGCSPIGLGTDIGGSVRVPAAFNGICSIKPTTERTIDQARFTEKKIDIPVSSVTGILANCAEDLSLFLNIMDCSNHKLKNFKDIDCSKLKIGYFISDRIFVPSESIKRGIYESIDHLKDIGAQVIEFQPPNLIEAEELYTKVLSANNLQIFSDNLRDDKPISLLKGFFALVRIPKPLRQIVFFLATIFRQKTLRRVINYFEQSSSESMTELEKRIFEFRKQYYQALNETSIGELDAIICPVFPTPAILHNTADKIGLGGSYNIQSNLTGFPAGVATVSYVKKQDLQLRDKSFDITYSTARKIEKESKGMPISVQILSRAYNDHIVIALIDKLHKTKNSNDE